MDVTVLSLNKAIFYENVSEALTIDSKNTIADGNILFRFYPIVRQSFKKKNPKSNRNSRNKDFLIFSYFACLMFLK